MKSHKYWSIGALITMLGTFYTGYKGSKEGHKYFAASSLLCMIMAIYTGHKMISGKSRKKKEVSVESVEDILWIRCIRLGLMCRQQIPAKWRFIWQNRW